MFCAIYSKVEFFIFILRIFFIFYNIFVYFCYNFLYVCKIMKAVNTIKSINQICYQNIQTYGEFRILYSKGFK